MRTSARFWRNARRWWLRGARNSNAPFARGSRRCSTRSSRDSPRTPREPTRHDARTNAKRPGGNVSVGASGDGIVVLVVDAGSITLAREARRVSRDGRRGARRARRGLSLPRHGRGRRWNRRFVRRGEVFGSIRGGVVGVGVRVRRRDGRAIEPDDSPIDAIDGLARREGTPRRSTTRGFSPGRSRRRRGGDGADPGGRRRTGTGIGTGTGTGTGIRRRAQTALAGEIGRAPRHREGRRGRFRGERPRRGEAFVAPRRRRRPCWRR